MRFQSMVLAKEGEPGKIAEEKMLGFGQTAGSVALQVWIAEM